MKAWILEEQDKIENRPLNLMEIPDPEPDRKEIVMKVKAVGICRTDIHIAEGDLPLSKAPIILGHEVTGRVCEIGEEVGRFKVGDKVGMTWLNSACGECEFCRSGMENLCPNAKFTGWDVDGGFAEYAKVPQDYGYRLPEDIPFHECVPMMCPGVAGYRSYFLTGAKEGDRLGIYGFGITGTYVLQIAKRLGVKTYVMTRSEMNKEEARKLGADWVGGYGDSLPEKLDKGIIFPAVGELVSIALGHLKDGGRLILAPVTMTPIVINDFNLVWGEREIKSLAHITRKDGNEIVKLAKQKRFETRVETFPFEDLQEAMIKVSRGEVNGNAVIEL